jgi:hypothetical protein
MIFQPNHYIRLLAMKVQKRTVNTICRHFYRELNHDINNSILIAGVARSGTTWLADLIRSQTPCRMMWEPFNPHKNDQYNKFPDFLYKRPSDSDPQLLEFATRVFNGDIRNKWIDREVDRLTFKYRLVKDVRINLFLYWLHENFPKIPLIFIIRHPCAVVLSRMISRWDVDDDIRAFLTQEKLVKDFLKNKLDLINNAKSIESKHAIIWAIQNLIPIKQFENSVLNLIFYEDLCTQPEIEIPKIFNMIGLRYQDTIFQQLNKPSRTIKKSSAVLTGEDKISRWKNVMTKDQIHNVLSIVEEMGLGYLYGSSLSPIRE